MAALAVASCGGPDRQSGEAAVSKALPTATYVGVRQCTDCHANEVRAWQGSHHDLAMQHATADTVLGDFNDQQFEWHDVRSQFLTRDDEFWVRTDNKSGELQEFKVAYVFGVEPLQQYLIEFDDGRLQALPIAWDAIGSRWYHLYPDEWIGHDDLLHWTGRQQNWNFMCAECHSTDLQKNYSLTTDRFDTTWSEINVSCEACHGPASNHVTLALDAELSSSRTGLQINLDDHAGAVWTMNLQTGIAERDPPLMSPSRQPESCGRCHSRRGLAASEYQFGKPLMDTHMVSLLDEGLYFADGQINDEVYVYGSFLQSKMYQAGVTCTDCHDPHTAELKSDGAVSNICSSCHMPDKFAAESHHRHKPDAVECVDCHMAEKNYMVIDGRRDHSFRVPRPDLTIATDAPNACSQCHASQTASWAAAAVSEWYGMPAPGHFAHALHDARSGVSGANDRLANVIDDQSVAGIVRATALSLLQRPMSSQQMEIVRRELSNPDPLVRMGALRAVAALPTEAHAEWAAPLLGDPVRSVRLSAVDVVSPVREALNNAYRPSFIEAERQYIDAQMAVAERPEAISSLAGIFRARGDVERSESYFRHALRLQPRAIGTRINMADLYRETQRDADAEELLREGISLDQDGAALHHSLGLLLVRTERREESLKELQTAAELQPDNARYTYVYAVALNSLGRQDDALNQVRIARERFPADFDIAYAQVTMLMDRGLIDDARAAAIALQIQYPDDPNAKSLLGALLGPEPQGPAP